MRLLDQVPAVRTGTVTGAATPILAGVSAATRETVITGEIGERRGRAALTCPFGGV